MNKERRAAIQKAIEHLEVARDIVDDTLTEEQFAMDNVPENLEGSERYQHAEDMIDLMDTVVDALTDSVEQLEEVISN